jgi:hypothetical protein
MMNSRKIAATRQFTSEPQAPAQRNQKVYDFSLLAQAVSGWFK